MGEAEAVHAERVRVEGAVVLHLVGALGVAGFSAVLATGERSARVQTPADAVREGDTFHLTVYATSTGGVRCGWALLIPGNGEDIVSDWGWTETPDGERMRAVLVEAGL